MGIKKTISRSIILAGAAFAALIGWAEMATAQEFVFRGSRAKAPSVDQYMKQAGPQTKEVPHGTLKIDGQPVNCGTRPTVLNPNFDSWGGAFPGFLILNTAKIKGLSTQVKLYIYSHECGHQFIGAERDQGRPVRDPPRREMGLARCARHGRDLHLHFETEGRCRASAGTETLQDHAGLLPRAGERKPAGKLRHASPVRSDRRTSDGRLP